MRSTCVSRMRRAFLGPLRRGHSHNRLVYAAQRAFASDVELGYTEQREVDLEQWRESQPGWTAYPPATKPTMTMQAFIDTYADIETGARLSEKEVILTGRLKVKRHASKALYFYDLTGSNGERLQVITSKRNMGPNFPINKVIKRGDVVALRGFPGKSNKGELSLVSTEITLLSPCMHELPANLSNPDVRYRQRYLDMLVNPQVTEHFKTRAKVLSGIRRFLEDRGFLEVETPVLWPKHGGASARPFATSSVALGRDLPLHMRVAPELFLKELVIGGMDRVFELGKVFRNEGIDALHNPEFTTCEFYQAHTDYKELMTLTQDLLRHVITSSVGEPLVRTAPDGALEGDSEAASITLDFSKEFAVLDVMDGLSEALGGRELPDPNDPASLPEYLDICASANITVHPPQTLPRALDALIGGLLEPQCIQPTFIVHHPECLSPLAKTCADRPGLTERFELFINKGELCNAYSELNDPQEQRRRFQMQAGDAASGDVEAQVPDDDFCRALEYGLPPTAGWGMGVDRLCMLLTEQRHIRDVLLFPMIKPREDKASTDDSQSSNEQ